MSIIKHQGIEKIPFSIQPSDGFQPPVYIESEQLITPVEFSRKYMLGEYQLMMQNLATEVATSPKPKGVTIFEFSEEILILQGKKNFFEKAKSLLNRNERKVLVDSGFTDDTAGCIIATALADKYVTANPPHQGGMQAEVFRMLCLARERQFSIEESPCRPMVNLMLNDYLGEVCRKANVGTERLNQSAIYNTLIPDNLYKPTVESLDKVIEVISAIKPAEIKNYPLRHKSIKVIVLSEFLARMGMVQIMDPNNDGINVLDAKKAILFEKNYNPAFFKALAYTGASGYYHNQGDENKALDCFRAAKTNMEANPYGIGQVDKSLIDMIETNLDKIELAFRNKILHI